jgi:p-cumate 2,3-dioxygenase subunit beta
MQQNVGAVTATQKELQSITRQQVEDFLYTEAYFLDEWELDEWLKLYTQDAEYLVPTNDLREAANPNNDLVYINHDFARLEALTVRLKDRRAHREYPTSNTTHLITNVRLMGVKDEDLLVTANFMVWRFRNKDAESFVGQYNYALTLVNGELKVRSKKVLMDMTTLRPAGAISIIL